MVIYLYLKRKEMEKKRKVWSDSDVLISLLAYKAKVSGNLDKIMLSNTAEKLGCTESSLKMAFSNFQYLRVGKGLKHYGKKQKQMYEKFYDILPNNMMFK
jgi:hypothetical protein